MSYTTTAARWRALSTRDPLANNHFVYTVKSTQIYCRPTCPARLARRANIGFAETPDEARRAGYRACKRCRPDLATSEDPQAKAVAQARALIEEAVAKGEGGGEGLRLQDLAKSVGLTRRYFHKIFKDRVGVTPREYAVAKMGERAGSGAGAEEAVDVVEGTCGSTAYVPLPPGGVVDMGPFSFDPFDFDDFLSFDVEEGGLPLSEAAVLPKSASSGSTPGSLDDMVTASILAPALATAGGSALDGGLDVVHDKTRQGDLGNSSSEVVVSTTVMIDMDAAFVLDSSTLPGFNQGVYDPVIG